MGGYIGSNIGTIANAAERKKTYSITTATTSLTGLAYTPTKVHVFHNGVRLVDGTDYTATNGTSITLTNAAQNGDEVVVISYPSFQTSDTVSAANGGTFAGNVAMSGTLDVTGVTTLSNDIDLNGNDLILDADGDSKIEASTDDTITVHTAGSEAMRIDSSGNVGIGTSSIDFTTAGRTVVHVEGSAGALLAMEDTGAKSYFFQSGNDLFLENDTASGSMVFGTNSSTERMRINSVGQVFVGTASNPGSSNTGVRISGTLGDNFWLSATTSTTAYDQLAFDNGNGRVGAISTSGTSTSYNTTSDYRLKENVVDVTDGITRVKQLSPKRFNFIADADTTVDGFLAHEAQAVVPEAVTGTHNEVDDDNNPVYQGIDQSKLVPLLTAALKEAITKIEDLETRVAALEGA